MAEQEEAIAAQSKFRSEFLQVLRSRRTPQVPLTVELAKPVTNPLHQNSPPSIEEIMQCCPKAEIDDIEGALKEENLYLNIEAYASRGYVAISVDSRYHGERASSTTTYRDALIYAWKTGETMPFIYDTVWDLIKLADYLTQREDIDPSRIGVTGVSLGGWLREVERGM